MALTQEQVTLISVAAFGVAPGEVHSKYFLDSDAAGKFFIGETGKQIHEVLGLKEPLTGTAAVAAVLEHEYNYLVTTLGLEEVSPAEFVKNTAKNLGAELGAENSKTLEADLASGMLRYEALVKFAEAEAEKAGGIEKVAGIITAQESDQTLDNAKDDLVDSAIKPETPTDPSVPGATISLTDGRDTLEGDANNNTFYADVHQNDFGLLVNELGTGDRIDGKGGINTLEAAMINDANWASVGVGGTEFAPRPITTNIQNVHIEALEDVTLDAGRMVGVKQFWSNNSRDDLKITDIRLAGTTDHSITKDVTFGLKDTDFDTGLTALFESQSLIRQGAMQTGSELRLNLKDLGTESNPYDPNEPLGQLNVDGFRFDVGDQRVVLQSDEILAAKTYSELFAAVQAALAAAQAEDASLAGLEVRLEENGFRAPGAYFGENDIRTVEGDSIVIRDQDGRTLEGAGWLQNGDTVDFTLYGRQTNEGPQIIENLIESNLVLDNAGRGSMGGDVVIGGMSGTRGVEKINLEVDRDSQISSLNTGTTWGQRDLNNLDITSTGANGNLNIGSVNANGTITQTGLTNVQNVNATAFEGSNLLLTAQVGQGAGIGATENAGVIGNYHYNMSGANNTLTFNVNQEASASSNFSLNINTRGGNDVINVNQNAGNTSQWAQHSELQNISINSTGGNNTVTLGQYGAATVKTGAGSDYIRTDYDNIMADNAQWLVNADVSTSSFNSALGNGNQTHNFFKTKVVVEFMGIKTDAVIIESNNFRTTSEQINNAIKKAIANDADLSKLLTVEDVRNEGLKITTTFDKALAAGDLDIQFLTPKLQGDDGANENLGDWAARETVSATELQSAWATYANSTWGEGSTAPGAYNGNATADDVLTALGATVGAIDGNAANATTNVSAAPYAVNQVQAGSNSFTQTMNVVNAGAGDDTIVLSSNISSNIKDGFDTVKFKGNFGHNTIVNFNTDSAVPGTTARDVLDFTSYLDEAADGRGSSANANVNVVQQSVGYTYNTTFANTANNGGFGYHNSVNYVELSAVWANLSTTPGGFPKSFAEISTAQLQAALKATVAPGDNAANVDMNGMKFVVILAQDHEINRDAQGNAIAGTAIAAPIDALILSGTVNVSAAGVMTYTLDKHGSITLAGAFSDLSDISADSVAGTPEAVAATKAVQEAIKEDAGVSVPTEAPSEEPTEEPIDPELTVVEKAAVVGADGIAEVSFVGTENADVFKVTLDEANAAGLDLGKITITNFGANDQLVLTDLYDGGFGNSVDLGDVSLKNPVVINSEGHLELALMKAIDLEEVNIDVWTITFEDADQALIDKAEAGDFADWLLF